MLTVTQLRVIDAVHRLGSVTAAADELGYAQPSISHHLARLEAETRTQLLQKVGRGVRLTEAGRLLAERAAEIIGRVDAAAAELSTLATLEGGLVRVAGFSSALSSLAPAAVTVLADRHPRLRIGLTESHPEESLALLRAGQVEVALIFRYDDTAPDHDVRLVHLLDDPLYLLTRGGGTTIEEHRETPWIGGCPRCSQHLTALCAAAGFSPELLSASDDMVVMQSLVAAGLGVTTIPGLALHAHRNPAVTATRLASAPRRIYAATYGRPPDPPATAAVLAALLEASAGLRELT